MLSIMPATVPNHPLTMPRFLGKLLPQPRPTWPNPEESVGELRYSSKNQNYWDTKGPALESLAPLKEEIKDLLNLYSDNITKKEPVSLLFDIFMIGRLKQTSCPTLIVICAKKEPRNRASKIIRESQLLDNYPGVLLGACSHHPRHPKSNPPQYIALIGKQALSFKGKEKENKNDSETVEIKVYTDIVKPEQVRTNGLSIYLPIDDFVPHENRAFRKSTIGGFLNVVTSDGLTVNAGLTVAHVFEASESITIATNSTGDFDDGFEFEFVSLTSDNHDCGVDNSIEPEPLRTSSKATLFYSNTN